MCVFWLQRGVRVYGHDQVVLYLSHHLWGTWFQEEEKVTWTCTILFPSLPKRGCQDQPLHTLPFLVSACAFWSSEDTALRVANTAELWMQPRDAAPRKGERGRAHQNVCLAPRKEIIQLQNVVLKESGQMLLSPVEKAQCRVKTPADSDPTSTERHHSVVWYRWSSYWSFFSIVSGLGMGGLPCRAGMLSIFSLSAKVHCSQGEWSFLQFLAKSTQGDLRLTQGVGVGAKRDLRPVTPQLKKRSWQLKKRFDLFQKL